MTKEHSAMLQMLCCAVLWSLGGLFIKTIPWHPFAIASGRSLFASLVLLAYLYFSKTKPIFNKRALFLAAIVFAISFVYTSANKLTTAANAIVLQYTAPIYVLVLSALLGKQRIKPADMLAVAFTLVGVLLCFFDQLNPGSMLGNLLALFSGVLLCGMFMVTAAASMQERLGGLVLAEILIALAGIPFFFTGNTVIEPASLLNVALMGVVQLGVPYLLYIRALQYCPPLTSSLLCTAEPLFAPIWVALAVGEVPGVFALIGCCVVVLTVTIWCVWCERQKQKQLAY